MRGVATARSAISVVNALPLGIGSALGIDWPARTAARFDPASDRSTRTTVEPASSDTRLVRLSARSALRQFGGAGPARLRLVVRSTIPMSRGLKSSSAVSASVVLATARALGKEPTAITVARLAAEASRAAGVSATGAFDDALAGLVTGGVVTDNRHDRELRRLELDPDLAVALWVPERPHPRSLRVRARFHRAPALARRAVDAALSGEWALAMELNSSLVEAAMGYRYGGLHGAVRRAGAVASGVSGLGPTFAAVAPWDRLRSVVRALPPEGRRRMVRLLPLDGRPHGSP